MSSFLFLYLLLDVSSHLNIIIFPEFITYESISCNVRERYSYLKKCMDCLFSLNTGFILNCIEMYIV